MILTHFVAMTTKVAYDYDWLLTVTTKVVYDYDWP